MEEKFLHAEGPGAGKSSVFQTKAGLNKPLTEGFALFKPELQRGKSTFCSAEKLKSKKLIELLFKKGKSVSQSGFTVVYLATPLNTFYPAQAGFSVPKSNFKKAVDRNRIKRLNREAYRLNKLPFYSRLAVKQQQMALMWVYKGKSIPVYEEVVKAVINCMNKITIQ
jgi:ribonuclease P protein component